MNNKQQIFAIVFLIALVLITGVLLVWRAPQIKKVNPGSTTVTDDYSANFQKTNTETPEPDPAKN